MRSLVLGLVLAVTPPAPAAVDDYLAAALESTGLPGVSVEVTHGDRIVHATGAGHDSLGNPVTADTPMRVASVSKSFTAATALLWAQLFYFALSLTVAIAVAGVAGLAVFVARVVRLWSVP